MSKTEEKKPKLRLVGEDGNAFFILGRAQRAAEEAGKSTEWWKEVERKATSGDYSNLLCVITEEFDVS